MKRIKVTDIVKQLDNIRVARPSKRFKKADNEAYYVLDILDNRKYSNVPKLLKFFKLLKQQGIEEVKATFWSFHIEIQFNDDRSQYLFRSY